MPDSQDLSHLSSNYLEPNTHSPDTHTSSSSNSKQSLPDLENDLMSPESQNQRPRRKARNRTPDQKPYTGTSESSPKSKDVPPQEPAAQKKERNAALIRELTGFYVGIGFFVTRFDMYDGVLVVQQAENRARELVRVAEKQPWLMRMLKQMLKGNVYVSLFLGHGLMGYAILAHHGRIRADQQFLAQLGYAETQIMAPPPAPTEESMNGQYAGATAF